MKRVLKFNKKEGRYDVPSFTLCDNDSLVLDIVAPTAQYGVYYFTAKHGQQIKRVVLFGRMSLELSPEWIEKGGTEPLLCELELRDKAGVVLYKRYEAEPLFFKEHKVGVECLASVQKLESDYNSLRNKVATIYEELLRLKKMVQEIPTQIEEAKKEAVIEAAGGDPMGA